MKRNFLIIYAIVVAAVTAVTVLFMIFGERKDSRYFIIMLILAIVGKVLVKIIDKRE